MEAPETGRIFQEKVYGKEETRQQNPGVQTAHEGDGADGRRYRVPVQGHASWRHAGDLATDPGQGLHARRAARAYPDIDGLDELAPASLQDRRPVLRRPDSY